MSDLFEIDAFAVSDPGCVRSNNEDYFITDPANGIFILADGMGGAKAGEFASQLSAHGLYKQLLASKSNRDPQCVEEAFSAANQLVWDKAQESREYEGMGTTLVALRHTGGASFEFGSVGDSRIYQVAKNVLKQITDDQTWVAEVGTRLGLTEQALKNHPMRHVLTMAVGVTEQIRVQTGTLLLEPGEQLLLSSDGLHGVISEAFVEEVLNSEKTLEQKCHYLVDAAKQHGGPDNVTVVLIRLI